MRSLPVRASRFVFAPLVLALLLVSTGSVHAQIFGPRTDLDTGTVPRSVAVGDVNEDGRPDVLVAVQGAGVVSIFRGAGGLLFLPRVDVAVRPQPIGLATGDWNGDGHLDFVVGAVSDSSIALYLGNGSGGFAFSVAVSCPVVPYEVELGDVTADGLLDVVVAADETSVALFDIPGLPGGGLGTPRALVAATGDRARSVEVAQIDGVHGADIYFSSLNGSSSVLRSDGAGGYLPALPVNGSQRTQAAALGDIDGDGRLDVVELGFHAAGTPEARLLRGLPSGSFSLLQTLETGPGAVAPVIADFNLDGRGDGAFLDSQGSRLTVLLRDCLFATEPAGINVPGTSFDLAAADFDGDGDRDYVMSGSTTASVSVIRNDGGFAAQCIPVPEVLPTAVDFGLRPTDVPVLQAISITNTGIGNLVVFSAVTGSAAFDVPGGLPPGIPDGQSRVLTVRALVPSLGVQLDTLTITTNSPGSPVIRIPLRVEGRPPMAPAVHVTPAALVFPLDGQGDASESTIHVFNLGESPLVLENPGFAGDAFEVVTAFPLSVPAGEFRPVVLRFPRVSLGVSEDTLEIATNDPTRPILAVPVSGEVRAARPFFVASPPGVDFGANGVGSISTVSLILRNDGELPLTVDVSPLPGPAFEDLGPAQIVLAPDQVATRTLRYLRPAFGVDRDTLRFVTDDPSNPTPFVPLLGTTTSGGAIPTWSPVVSFGSGVAGDSSTISRTIGNTGSSSYRVMSFTSGSPEFTVKTSLPLVVPANGSAQVEFVYRRLAVGVAAATVTLHTDQAATPQMAFSLSGSASVSTRSATLAASSLDFGSVATGSSTTRTFVVGSNGSSSVTISGVTANSPAFVLVSPSLPVSISPGNTRTFTVRFDAMTPGPVADTLRIQNNGAISTLSLPVTAAALVAPSLVLAPEALDPVFVGHDAMEERALSIQHGGGELALAFQVSLEIDAIELSPGVPAPIASAPEQLRIDGDGRSWILRPDGAVGAGDPGAFVRAADWAIFPDVAAVQLTDGGRSMRYGPVLHQNRWELTREAHVSATEGWIRYVETVRNTSNSAGTFQIHMSTTHDLSLVSTIRTADGVGGFSVDDDWIVVADETGPAVAHVIAGPGGARRPSYANYFGAVVAYSYQLPLGAGESASVVHYLVQAATLEDAMARAEALRQPGRAARLGIDPSERAAVCNFAFAQPIRPSPNGGSVPIAGAMPLGLVFDGTEADGLDRILATLRITANDPNRPLTEIPLDMRLTGADPGVVDVGPGGAPLTLAARFLPNPASGGRLRLAYALPVAGTVRFELFDVRGRRVASRAIEDAPAGPGSLDWNGRSEGGLALAPGVYWTRVTLGERVVLAKGVLLR